MCRPPLPGSSVQRPTLDAEWDEGARAALAQQLKGSPAEALSEEQRQGLLEAHMRALEVRRCLFVCVWGGGEGSSGGRRLPLWGRRGA